VAELLVKAVSATHTDPTKDARGCYKQGDVVRVVENGHEWGALELRPPAAGGKFVVIKITDVTRQQVINWVRNHWGCEVEGVDWVTEPTPDPSGINARRRVRIDVDLVPNNVRNQLNQNGVYTTTWTAIRQYVRNKRTSQTGAGVPI
jgi:hypothetical protein